MLVMGGEPHLPVVKEKPSFDSDSYMADLQRKGSLRVGVMQEQPGICSRVNGELQGFEVDIVLMLAQSLFGGTVSDASKYVEYVETPLPLREDVILSGDVDMVVANFADTPKRRNNVDFVGHYMFTPNAPLTSVSCPEVTDSNSLNGLRVAVMANSVQGDLLPTIAPHAEMVEFAGLPDALDALANERVEMLFSDVVSNKGYTRYLNPDYGTPALRYDGERWGVGIRKGTSDLGMFVDKNMQTALETGALNNSIRRWLG